MVPIKDFLTDVKSKIMRNQYTTASQKEAQLKDEIEKMILDYIDKLDERVTQLETKKSKKIKT